VGAVYVVGDIHGHYDKLVALLRDAALIGADARWTGDDRVLWFIGDLVDRGPDGVAVVELVIRLQQEAPATGGEVRALAGNHDLLLVSAYRFGARSSSGPGGTFLADWQWNGGVMADLERMTPRLDRWFTTLPAMARVDGHLLVHADALLYTHYGRSVDEVNRCLAALLRSDDAAGWDRLLDEFSEHGVFARATTGSVLSAAFLHHFGGTQIVHGHTPITKMTGHEAETVQGPHAYAGGRCLNVDGGMYLGGSGFVHHLPLSAWGGRGRPARARPPPNQ
jgi:hypothetical protein